MIRAKASVCHEKDFGPASRGEERRGLLGLACCVLVFLCIVRFYFAFPSTVEDSFILFRYARHLSAHQGLSWNPGMPRDQGLTGVAWATLVGLILRVFGGEAPRIAGYLGLTLGCCTLVVFYRALRGILRDAPPYTAVVGTFSLALSPYFQRHTASGMETVLTFLLFAMILLVTVEAPMERAWFASGMTVQLSVVSFLIRPDAPLFCLGVLIPLIFWKATANRMRRAALTFLLSVGAIVMIAALLGRYFATALPLPAYLKLSAMDVIRHPRAFLPLVPVVLTFQIQLCSVTCVWIVLFLLWVKGSTGPTDARMKAIVFGTGAFFLYLFTVVPIMNFAMRYQSPLLIPILFAGTVSLTALLRRSQVAGYSRRVAAAAVCLVLICSQMGAELELRSEVRENAREHFILKPLGEQLRAMPGVKVTSSEAGVLPYFSDSTFLDLIGLNNTFVALNKKKAGYDQLLDRYLATQFGYPDLYVRKIVWVDPYADLCGDPAIIARYDFAGEVNGAGSPGLFVLRGSPYADRLRTMIDNLGMRPVSRASHPGAMTAEEGCQAAQEKMNMADTLAGR